MAERWRHIGPKLVPAIIVSSPKSSRLYHGFWSRSARVQTLWTKTTPWSWNAHNPTTNQQIGCRCLEFEATNRFMTDKLLERLPEPEYINQKHWLWSRCCHPWSSQRSSNNGWHWRRKWMYPAAVQRRLSAAWIWGPRCPSLLRQCRQRARITLTKREFKDDTPQPIQGAGIFCLQHILHINPDLQAVATCRRLLKQWMPIRIYLSLYSRITWTMLQSMHLWLRYMVVENAAVRNIANGKTGRARGHFWLFPCRWWLFSRNGEEVKN